MLCGDNILSNTTSILAVVLQVEKCIGSNVRVQLHMDETWGETPDYVRFKLESLANKQTSNRAQLDSFKSKFKTMVRFIIVVSESTR